MSARAQKLTSLAARTTFLKRKFHAWWEGYAFDDVAELAAVASEYPGSRSSDGLSSREIVAQSIWGTGRFEPGSPAWTIRYARMLSLPVRANVVVFGAGGGAVIEDLRHGTRWKTKGFTRHESAASGKLQSYSTSMHAKTRLKAAGALSFFELHKEPDPAYLTGFVSDQLLPGAKAVFLDFTVPKRMARLNTCFPSSEYGAPKALKDFSSALESSGFRIVEISDESSLFLPLIQKGWAGWRKSYDSIRGIENTRVQTELLSGLSQEAQLWAERFDAIKAGRLQVTRFQVLKN